MLALLRTRTLITEHVDELMTRTTQLLENNLEIGCEAVIGRNLNAHAILLNSGKGFWIVNTTLIEDAVDGVA